MLPRAVRSDLPFPPFIVAKPGIHSIKRNPHGAVAALVDGNLLGLKPDEFELMPTLDWVICGGESGPGARPMHPDWARGLRDQCTANGVPFFFKQWGEYLPPMTDGGMDRTGAQVINASDDYLGIGKHAAGAFIDRREWKQFPAVRA
jgi:protein gp37